MKRITFDKVSIRRTARYVEDGRKKQKTREFFQTVNPFNKNADGSVKTRKQILDELNVEALAWLQSFASGAKERR